MSLALFIGSLVLCLWMGLGVGRWVQIALVSMTRSRTINLVVIVWLIMVMSKLMNETGHMDRLVGSFVPLSKDPRVAGSFMAALIGLLPMPGGALFSAPMVETSMAAQSVTSEQKTLLNYWFRHVWEYWWPLYPGVVLAIALLKVESWLYMAMMAPMTLISVLAGFIFILRPMKKIENRHSGGPSWAGIRAFLWESMPILIVVFLIIALAGLVRGLALLGYHAKISGAFSIMPGLFAALIWVCRVNRIPLGQFKSALMDKSILPMLYLLMAVMVFQGVLTGSQAAVQIRDELMAYRVPLILIVLILPFLSGLVTGIAIGFVGTSFPLVVPMFPAGSTLEYMSYAALAFSFGYMGMMFSPVHLCLLVTKDYYRASLLKSYRQLALPALSVMVMVLALFFVTRVAWQAGGP